MRQLARWSAVLAVGSGLLLTACAPHVWMKPGATAEEYTRDIRQCDYESSIATQNVNYSYRSILVQSMDQAFRQSDLQRKCLMARGWTYTRVTEAETPPPAPPVMQALPPIVQTSLPQPPAPAATPAPESEPVAVPLVVASPSPVAVVPTAAVAPATPPAEGASRILRFLLQYSPAPLLRTPDMAAGKVGKVDSGGTVQVLREDDGWLWVETRTGTRGWVAKAWLQP